MKIRILTRRAGYNFGSSLQAYAMQQIISNLGYENKVLDYDESSHNIRWRIRPFVDDVLYSILRLMPFINKSLYKRLHNRYLQRAKFDAFDNLLNKTQYCKNAKALAAETRGSYACVCGSDQIWNPFLFDRNFFLSFLTDESVKKVAYAPSIGVSDKSLCSDEMVNLMSKFDSISIREKRGAEIVGELLNKDIPCVLDPTLLVDIDNWERVEKECKIDGEYILCYFLGKQYIPHNFINQLKAISNCKIVNIQMYYNINDLDADVNLLTVSPDEFLSLTANAKYICTDSFHSTVFSTLYKRNFFVFDRFNNAEAHNQNSRIDTLLDVLYLKGRRMTDSSILNSKDLLDIDYSLVDIKDLKADSLSFLHDALIADN